MKSMTEKKPTLLIVDDETINIDILIENLGEEYKVYVATNGTAALASAKKNLPDLILLDIMMPEMDGIETCRRIRTLKTDQPPYIIMLTSRDKKKDIIVGLEAGANDYIAKPYDPGELQARVNVGRRIIEMQAKLAAHAQELQKTLREQEKITIELRDALSQVKILSGMLPICASCKMIRNEKGYWEQMEIYIRDHSEAEFSHGICPECAERLYPEFYKIK